MSSRAVAANCRISDKQWGNSDEYGQAKLPFIDFLDPAKAIIKKISLKNFRWIDEVDEGELRLAVLVPIFPLLIADSAVGSGGTRRHDAISCS
jgi:hypothetical protein